MLHLIQDVRCFRWNMRNVSHMCFPFFFDNWARFVGEVEHEKIIENMNGWSWSHRLWKITATNYGGLNFDLELSYLDLEKYSFYNWTRFVGEVEHEKIRSSSHRLWKITATNYRGLSSDLELSSHAVWKRREIKNSSPWFHSKARSSPFSRNTK